MTIKPVRFTEADAIRASDEWGANCGPGSLAAICGLTLDEVRPQMRGFEGKGYTNPTLMFSALDSLGVSWRATKISEPMSLHAEPKGLRNVLEFPNYGLARIQWEGPWTRPGVPMRVRYRHTHWVGAMRRNGEIGIFDINMMKNGSGWASLENWRTLLVPWLLEECVPRADGKWHITHAIEVAQS